MGVTAPSPLVDGQERHHCDVQFEKSEKHETDAKKRSVELRTMLLCEHERVVLLAFLPACISKKHLV